MSSSGEKHTHPYGKPVIIFDLERNYVDDDQLEIMFSHPDVLDRKMVVFSIIGALRKGKSFFLDYCLRFLYANVSSMNLV